MSKAILVIDKPEYCDCCPVGRIFGTAGQVECMASKDIRVNQDGRTISDWCPLKEMPKCMEEKNYTEELFKLIAENPDLPIVPMVYCDVVADDYGRWLGAWGSSYIGEYILGEDRVHFREDDDPSEVEKVLFEQYGRDYYLDISDEQKAYAELPWIKAIIVNIDLPS